jgi:hypothetical protein
MRAVFGASRPVFGASLQHCGTRYGTRYGTLGPVMHYGVTAGRCGTAIAPQCTMNYSTLYSGSAMDCGYVIRVPQWIAGM